MKQICKRLSAIFLALTLVSGTVLTTGLVVNADTYKEIFSDNFNSYKKDETSANRKAMLAKGWNTDSKSMENYITGADYKIPSRISIRLVTSDFSGASEWTNYSVEAKMTFVANTSATGTTTAGITGRGNSETRGYDLLIKKANPTDEKATLVLRYDGKNVDDKTITIPSNGTPFVLKLEFRGTMLYGYLDNEVIYSRETANDEKKSSKGWAGICKTVKNSGMDVAYDNFVVSEITPSSYPEGYLYYNNFDTNSTLAEAGFSKKGTNAINNGSFYLGAGYYSYLEKVVDALYWEDYTVEADVQMIKMESDTATTGYAGIVARSTDGASQGYEFRMTYKGGSQYLELYKRNGATKSMGTYPIAFDFNTYYKMTISVVGNNIMCWFNNGTENICVFDVEDKDEVVYATGYAGVRSPGDTNLLNARVDNFGVKAYQPPTITYPEGYLYCNDFSSKMRLTNEGWSSDVGTKENGVYVLEKGQSNYLTGVDGSTGWTDYVVEADVMINYSDSDLFDQYAAIVGRSTNKSKTGYELRLIRREDGDIIRLFKKGASDWKINGEDHTAHITLEQGKMNALKMVFKGADIYCYLNGEIVFEVTDNDNPYLEGYAGVISQGGTVSSTYDNFVVRDIDEATDFPADAVYPEGYLYYNDFSALRGLHNEGWRSTGTKKDGSYILNGESYNYLTKVEGSSEWTDYVVDADVILHDNGEYPQYTSIVARCSEPKVDGYELRLITESEGNTVIRLQKQGVSSGKINDIINIINVSVKPNEKHSLKMVVQGATIICYFDGIKMFDVTDKNEPYMTGYAGVRSVSGTAKSSFDYFAVREIGAADIVKDAVINKQDGDIWFYDNFTGEESMTERGWNTDKVALYKRSALVKSRVVISNVKDSDKWTDYEVSAIVFVDKEAGMYQDTSSGAAAICARTVSSDTGYEFGILTSPTSASYLRLNDRTNDKVIATDKTIPITSGEHTLRMVCIGNEISCFFDDTFVFTVQSDACANGYAGMRANSYNAYFKEFSVRKARPVATILPSGPVSPSTGDRGMNVAVIYTAALILSLSMIGLVVTVSYGRKKYV